MSLWVDQRSNNSCPCGLILENELVESYLYENLTRFHETKFENSQAEPLVFIVVANLLTILFGLN
jgi:hypothetical protein